MVKLMKMVVSLMALWDLMHVLKLKKNYKN